jgi:hypothetical protein
VRYLKRPNAISKYIKTYHRVQASEVCLEIYFRSLEEAFDLLYIKLNLASLRNWKRKLIYVHLSHGVTRLALYAFLTKTTNNWFLIFRNLEFQQKKFRLSDKNPFKRATVTGLNIVREAVCRVASRRVILK